MKYQLYDCTQGIVVLSCISSVHKQSSSNASPNLHANCCQSAYPDARAPSTHTSHCSHDLSLPSVWEGILISLLCPLLVSSQPLLALQGLC